MFKKTASLIIPPPAPLMIVIIDTPIGSKPRFTAINAPVIANKKTAIKSYVSGS